MDTEEAKKLYVQDAVKSWQRKSYTSLIILLIVIVCLVYGAIFYYDITPYLNKDILGDFKFWLFTLIFGTWFSFSLKIIYDTHRNYSNIENYKKSLELPKELK